MGHEAPVGRSVPPILTQSFSPGSWPPSPPAQSLAQAEPTPFPRRGNKEMGPAAPKGWPQQPVDAPLLWGEAPLQSLGYLRRVHRVLMHRDAKPPPAASRIRVSRAASATCMFQVRGWSLCSTGQQAPQRRERLRTRGCARFLLRPGALNSCRSRASSLAAQGQAPREPIPTACALGSSGLRPVPASRSPPATQSSPQMCC